MPDYEVSVLRVSTGNCQENQTPCWRLKDYHATATGPCENQLSDNNTADKCANYQKQLNRPSLAGQPAVVVVS